jgi:hypothetical protein
MKKVITYVLLLAMPAITFCQKTNDSIPAVKTDYLVKSKNQKTAAWVLLGGGVALMGAGYLIGDSKNATLMMQVPELCWPVLAFFQQLEAFPFLLHPGKTKEKQ